MSHLPTGLINRQLASHSRRQSAYNRPAGSGIGVPWQVEILSLSMLMYIDIDSEHLPDQMFPELKQVHLLWTYRGNSFRLMALRVQFVVV